MSSLFIILWIFTFGAFSFAFCALFVPFPLLLIGPGACRPVALNAVSPVIRPEWHQTLRQGRWGCRLNYIGSYWTVCLSLPSTLVSFRDA
jgi:hypothetical protein